MVINEWQSMKIRMSLKISYHPFPTFEVRTVKYIPEVITLVDLDTGKSYFRNIRLFERYS
jgi:hypothetical protein